MSLCLSEIEFRGLAVGDLSGKVRERTLAHLVDCSQCRQRVSALCRDLDEPSVPLVEPPAELVEQALRQGRVGAPRRRYAWAAALLVGLLGVAAWNVLERDLFGPETASSRGADFSLQAPGIQPLTTTKLGDTRIKFAWSPVPAAARYLFEVVEVNGELVLQRETSSDSVTIDLGDERLRRNHPYYWRVVAIVRDTARVPSEFQEIVLAP